MADEPLLSGASMARAAGFDLSIPSAAILVFDESLVPRPRRRNDVGPRHPFRRLSVLDEGVSVACAAGPGAPSAAVAVEFLAAFGVATVVAVGSAGDLHGSLPTAAHSITSAVSDEGTSAHYASDLSADQALCFSLTEAVGRPAITTLTTDVPFRHTPQRLEQHRSRADVVEMECAAVFAVARAFDMKAGALLVVSDHFEGNKWRLRGRPEVGRALVDAVATAVATIAANSASPPKKS